MSYELFRQIYSRQTGAIPADILRELDSLQSRIENDELREATYQLLTLEALATQGHSEILEFRPTILDDNPNSDRQQISYYRDAALNWMELNSNRYQTLQNNLVEIELPTIQEVRELLPHSENDGLVLEDVFDENVLLSDYVEELSHLVQEQLQNQPEQIWDRAYQLLGRIPQNEPVRNNGLMPNQAFYPHLTMAVLRNRPLHSPRYSSNPPNMAFAPALILAVLRTRYMCRFTGR